MPERYKGSRLGRDTKVYGSNPTLDSNIYIRSYHEENTLIHSNQEVKPHRAEVVLSWGTRWEVSVTNVLDKVPEWSKGLR